MSLAETLASLEEPQELRDLREVIGHMGVEAERVEVLLGYCTGERLPRTGRIALSGADTDAHEPTGSRTLVGIAERTAA